MVNRMTIRAWCGHVWHKWAHGIRHSMLERAPGEVFLRCLKCGRRSDGLKTGPLKVRSRLGGDPDRFRQPPRVIAVPRQLDPEPVDPVLVPETVLTKTIH
jgi:hypothetical protein